MGKGGKASEVTGALAAGLSPRFKSALLMTPATYERHSHLVDLAATLYTKGYIDKDFYHKITVGDPIRSLARQADRMGVSEWARRVSDSDDKSALLGAASEVLGVDQEGTIVKKRDVGVDTRTMDEMVREHEYAIPDEASIKPPRTLEDGLTLDPDELTVGGDLERFGAIAPPTESALPRPKMSGNGDEVARPRRAGPTPLRGMRGPARVRASG